MTVTSSVKLARIRAWQIANPEAVRAARRRYKARRREARRKRGKPAKLSRREARLRQIITANHYTHSCPAGASWWLTYGGRLTVIGRTS
jgi:hypothetical protein